MENITSNFSVACGTYEQLEYWPNNFDDFGVSHTWMSADGLSPEPEVQTEQESLSFLLFSVSVLVYLHRQILG